MSVRSTWHGPKIKRDMEHAAAEGLYKWAEHVLEEAQRIVPLLEGTLQDSGTAHEPGKRGLGRLEAAVTYDTPYAVPQHEEMDYHHAPGRQAKYLETPLNASRDKGMELVQHELRKATGG